MTRNKGFTLIEVLIALVIVAGAIVAAGFGRKSEFKRTPKTGT